MECVLYKNEKWMAKCGYLYFQSIQHSAPNTLIEIEKGDTKKMVRIAELELWTIVRNLNALNIQSSNPGGVMQ